MDLGAWAADKYKIEDNIDGDDSQFYGKGDK